MLKTAFRPLTVQDYRELPEGPPYYQLIEGDLEMSPAPSRIHQAILRNISCILFEFLQRNPTGEFYFAPIDVFLTDLNVYQPDLVFISKPRASILTDDGLIGAPDLVVEVLSPKTAKLDRGIKRQVYARAGVTEMWIVDLEVKQIQVFHLTKSAERPAGVDKARQSFLSPLFAGRKISVAKIFRR